MGEGRMRTGPDYFIGQVMAVEGIDDAAVVLHGQNGCRKGLLDGEKLNPHTGKGRRYNVPYYAGTPSVPFTRVNQGDYTGGSYAKAVKALAHIKDEGYRMVVAVCSPGLSLIGDDLDKAAQDAGITSDFFVAKRPLADGIAEEGFDETICEVLDRLGLKREQVRKDTVCLLGLSIMTRDWSSVKEEMSYLLGLMGLRVICVPGAGCTIDDMKASAEAEFLIELCPGLCGNTGQWYSEHLGMEPISTGIAPIGPDATSEWVRTVAEVTGKDPTPALEYIKCVKNRVYRHMFSSGLSLRGLTFGIVTTPDAAVPITEMLVRDFGMVASYVGTVGTGQPTAISRLKEFLVAHGMGADDTVRTDIFISDGDSVRETVTKSHCRVGVPITFPFTDDEFVRSQIVGPSGVLYLLDTMCQIAEKQ